MKTEKAINQVDVEGLPVNRRKLITGGFFKDGVLGIAVLMLVGGTLLLAVIDPTSRPMFADLTKICLGAYIGLLMPKGK
jgi:hypothetical protein